MSNEELCMLIKEGDDRCLPQLWEQVERLIALKARRFYYVIGHRCGLEVDDLIQSGYFAVLDAVKYFRPEKELKFTSYLGNTLKTAFIKTAGLRTSKRDPLNDCLSLDEPLQEEEDITFLDTLPDIAAEEAFNQVVEDVYSDEIRAFLEKVMSKVSLSDTAREYINLRYYSDFTYQQIADIRGISKAAIEEKTNTALNRIRRRIRNSTMNEFFIDI